MQTTFAGQMIGLESQIRLAREAEHDSLRLHFAHSKLGGQMFGDRKLGGRNQPLFARWLSRH
jgi:hypothetical protein